MHRLHEAHLLQKRRELRFECMVRPAHDFLRAQPEILLGRCGAFAAEYSHESAYYPINTHYTRKTCRAGGNSTGCSGFTSR